MSHDLLVQMAYWMYLVLTFESEDTITNGSEMADFSSTFNWQVVLQLLLLIFKLKALSWNGIGSVHAIFWSVFPKDKPDQSYQVARFDDLAYTFTSWQLIPHAT